jgi:hypothetical protein
MRRVRSAKILQRKQSNSINIFTTGAVFRIDEQLLDSGRTRTSMIFHWVVHDVELAGHQEEETADEFVQIAVVVGHDEICHQ